MLRANKAKHLSTEKEDQNASIVERFNRALSGNIHRIISQNNQGEYLKQLELIIKAYNKTIHNSSRFKQKYKTHENSHKVWFPLNERQNKFRKYVRK